jgi:hypothetical protein
MKIVQKLELIYQIKLFLWEERRRRARKRRRKRQEISDNPIKTLLVMMTSEYYKYVLLPMLS